MFTLQNFYRSREWQKLTEVLKLKQLQKNGEIICDYCRKPIIKKYDCICHHKTFLTEANVNNIEVSLNSDNIVFVHHKCHNLIHEKFQNKRRKVYIVYGSPFSGKTTYVNSVKNEGDLIVNIDLIWQCVSGCEKYVKPTALKENVFDVRDKLLEQIYYRLGNWENAYIIGGYPLIAERERLAKRLSAEEVFIDTPKIECISRLNQATDKRNKKEWQKYIDDWFDKYKP